MEDPHRQPGDRDRAAVASRVRQAHERGLIGDADRDIRLENVRSAHSMFELDLMSRELDQVMPAAPAATWVPPSVLPPAASAGVQAGQPQGRPSTRPAQGLPTSGRRRGPVLLIVAVVVVAVVASVGAALFAGVRAVRDAVESGVPAEAGPGPGSGDTGPAYALTEEGVRSFLEFYRETHGTSRVVDLTLFGDYVVVNVPVDGGKRQEGWVYREDSGFTTFGGVRASFPGARVVDTRRLNVPALMRNIARARKTLKVERPTQTYVVVRFVARAERVPSVDIHVANEFNESGYLATRLNGKVERAFPYDG